MHHSRVHGDYGIRLDSFSWISVLRKLKLLTKATDDSVASNPLVEREVSDMIKEIFKSCYLTDKRIGQGPEIVDKNQVPPESEIRFSWKFFFLSSP